MTRDQRREAFAKLRKVTTKHPVMSIIGGEPTLHPNLLVEAVSDATEFGFLVSVVTNGWGLTPELIGRLKNAGLLQLAISVDCDQDSQRNNLGEALNLLAVAKAQGIIPVINTVITRNTDTAVFKQFAQTVIEQGFFIAPLGCSPAVPGGAFSNAPMELVPTISQYQEIVPWLMWKKITTGGVTSSFGYLSTLLHAGRLESNSSSNASPR